MYQSGQSMSMNSTSTNAGEYVASDLAPKVEALYENLDDDLKAVIKTVTIQCNDGLTYYQTGNAETATHDYTCHLFFASATEVGFCIFFDNKQNCCRRFFLALVVAFCYRNPGA